MLCDSNTVYERLLALVDSDFAYRDVSCDGLLVTGVDMDCTEQENRINEWKGGESRGLELLQTRVQSEQEAFMRGIALPNQYKPDLLGAPLSLSPYLRFGAVSIRLFYQRIKDAFYKVTCDRLSLWCLLISAAKTQRVIVV